MLKKRKIGKYIFLNIITLGIYGIVFWYKWTEDVNKICDGDDKDSANYLLMLILDVVSLGISVLVWNYQMAERLYQKAGDYGFELKHGGMYVMMLRFIPFASSALKISYINKFVDAYNAEHPVAETAEAEEAKEEAAEAEAVEETAEVETEAVAE